MTEIEKQIRDALAKATPGEWVQGPYYFTDIHSQSVGGTVAIAEPRNTAAGNANAALIVLLRNNATALLDRLAAAEAEVERLRAALRPFAEADATFRDTAAEDRIWIGHYVTREDFRRARSALAKEAT